MILRDPLRRASRLGAGDACTPSGELTGALELTADMPDALKILGLPKQAKVVVSVRDAAIFETRDEALGPTPGAGTGAQIVIDFDASSLKDRILGAVQKISNIQFGFDVAGLSTNLPLSVRGLLGDLTRMLQRVGASAAEYAPLLIASGLPQPQSRGRRCRAWRAHTRFCFVRARVPRPSRQPIQFCLLRAGILRARARASKQARLAMARRRAASSTSRPSVDFSSTSKTQ